MRVMNIFNKGAVLKDVESYLLKVTLTFVSVLSSNIRWSVESVMVEETGLHCDGSVRNIKQNVINIVATGLLI